MSNRDQRRPITVRSALLQELGNGRTEVEVKSLAAGLQHRNVPCEFFLEKRLQRRQRPLRSDVLVAGHIPVVISALRQLGVEPPVPNDYPDCLRPWLRRRMWTTTVRDVVAKLQDGVAAPFFAKPLGRHKRFRGHVFQSWDDLRVLGGASDHTQVRCSEVVEWKTEYRVYVVRGRIVGVGHYMGDAHLDIDRAQVEEAVAQFEASGQASAGYGIDFGVLSSGETALIEVNDGYSLGSYGLDDDLYTELIVARWCQLMEAHGRPVAQL
jgi:hypothetical protein